MDSSDSSPNYTRATTSFDAKKDHSLEESECDERSSINEIKHTTSNKKTVKNFGSVKSFRRRAPKSRFLQSPALDTFSDSDSLVDSSESSSSPNYLKSTSSSNGKKTLFQTTPPKLSSPKPKSSQTRPSSSLRNVRVLIKNSSFKPKRSPLSNRSKVSEDVSVDRATYSSIVKDSKFPKVVEELLPEKVESKEVSKVKVCRYHHCSLHGHCHGDNHDDPVPPIKKFVYKRRLSMKKQRSSIIPKDESSGKNKNLQKKQTVPSVERLNREQTHGDGYDGIKKSGFTEVAFAEKPLHERSYEENVDVVGKYCLRCSCAILNERNNEIPGNGFSSVLDANEDVATSSCGNEESNKDCPQTPVKDDEEAKKKSVFSCSQTSSDNNSEEERESIAESTPAEVSKINEVVEVTDYSDKNTPSQERGSKLQFSKPRHISMWHLIHEHMSSNSPESKSSESTDSHTDLFDSDVSPTKNDSEIQEIELRKLFAIKLVREAIEKILLPEIQDQASDDLSVTSGDTPRSEPTEENNQSKEFDADKGEIDVSSNPKEERVITDDVSALEIKETERNDVRKSEKKAPKHWSNLKKWILLQRFIRELEKVRRFNPKKPQLLPINPDPEAEKVNLRPQAVGQRKNSEEWMLDYAIRQAVNQLAPTQKRKVALLVKAFETVVPSEEDQPLLQSRISKLKDSFSEGNERNKWDFMSNNGDIKTEEPYSTTQSLILAVNGKSVGVVNTLVPNEIMGDDEREREGKPTLEAIQEDKRERKAEPITKGLQEDDREREAKPTLEDLQENEREREDEPTLEVLEEDERDREAKPTLEDLQKDALISDLTEGNKKESDHQFIETDKKNQIKMWHMIYRHVVSGIVEKMGSELLDGAEDDGAEKLSPSANDPRNGFTKSDALKLVKEAVDEILLPEVQEDSSTIDSVSEQDVSERTHKEEVVQKPKNWSKLKKLLLLKRSIRALEKARILKPQPHHHHHQTVDIEQEKVDLRSQMTEERKKAEEWMIDYAVRNMVTKLTPARKTRVSMLVEAFEAVVPLPEM